MSTPPVAATARSTALPVGAGDPAVILAQTRENIAVGDEIIRHKLSSRVMHWTVAFSFIVLFLTGMPIWSPYFTWMGALLGGLHTCRWLHPWAGVVFAIGMLWMFIHWVAEMRLTGDDAKWLSPSKLIAYMKYPAEDPNIGKYNGGQKLLFWTSMLGVIALFTTGFILWWPVYFGQILRELSIVVHDGVFILFSVMIVGHIYLGSAAFPGTFQSMVRGTVMKAWARLHHPRWYREVTGDDGKHR